MTEIKFGVIGCGLMGREFASAAARWMHLLDMPAKPVIVGVSDVNSSVMEWFATHHPGITTTTNYQDLLADPNIEAIYCAVPHNLHEQIYVDCIRAGKHLFAEKPFGIDLPAAEKICQAITDTPQVIVRCSSEFPFFPAAQRIAQMVTDGAFGQIIELKAGFCRDSTTAVTSTRTSQTTGNEEPKPTANTAAWATWVFTSSTSPSASAFTPKMFALFSATSSRLALTRLETQKSVTLGTTPSSPARACKASR